MKKYARRAIVSAEPMNEKEAQERFLTSANTDGHEWQEGYCLMETFPNGKETRQWMPKVEFEALFKPADTSMDRLRAEREEMKERVGRLEAFSRTGTFHRLIQVKRELLLRQIAVMKEYLYFLNIRIELEKTV